MYDTEFVNIIFVTIPGYLQNTVSNPHRIAHLEGFQTNPHDYGQILFLSVVAWIRCLFSMISLRSTYS